MSGNLFSAQAPGASSSGYANFFAQSQGNAMPAHLNAHALSAALADYSSNSVPNSAASSPGQQPRRLGHSTSASGLASGTATGASTPGGNSRVAASAITGKRLNWSEMICQTIAESESGKLVIQDLFEEMCNKFPEIREWAFGPEWEARVKNRIKSTLSIKGNLFIKVARPSSASGKGSWWTLSQEAQDAWAEGRVASVVKSGTHSRSLSQGRGLDNYTTKSATNSRAGSRVPSRRGSPASSRGPSSQHANNQHNLNNNRGTPHQNYVSFGQDNFSNNSPSGPTNYGYNNQSHSNRQSPSANLPVGLGMSPFNFGSASFEGLSMTGTGGLDGSEGQMGIEPSARRMRMMENSVNDGFDPTISSGGGNPGGMSTAVNLSMTSMAGRPGGNQAAVNLSMTTMPGGAGGMYDMSPYGSFPSSATSLQNMGQLQSAAHLGGPQSMPFPAHSSDSSSATTTSMPTPGGGRESYSGGPTTKDEEDKNSQLNSLLFDNSFSHYGGIDLSTMDGMNNPFGSMAGGYTMLSDTGGAQPTPIPGANYSQQASDYNHNDSGSGGRATPSVPGGGSNSFNANFMGGPSPADSTGSTSAYFAYTPAVMAADAAMGNGQALGGSALGPVGGEGSKKKKEGFSELQLPPPEQGGDANNNNNTQHRSNP